MAFMAADYALANPLRRTLGVARRITAVVVMAILLGLAFSLVWSVYLHHQRDAVPEPSTMVRAAPTLTAQPA